jgi:Ca2+-transporting ATPase
VEDVAIVVAVLIVVVSLQVLVEPRTVSLFTSHVGTRRRFVKVVRDSREQLIHLHDGVVGDVVVLEPGEVIPCDGLW